MEVAVLPSVSSAPSSSPPQPQSTSNREDFRHKNHLQEYTQRSTIPLPLYQTVNEGFPHAPSFRSTVIVDGMVFKSSNKFLHRKAAEQDVARIALEVLSKRVQQEGFHLLHVDPIFCKSILNEYAVKMNVSLPTYTNTHVEGLLPTFISTVNFDGKIYKGSVGKNKKEAEQIAARSTIETILGDSSTRSIMAQIIKAKSKLYAALHKDEEITEELHSALPISGPMPARLPQQVETTTSNSTCTEVQGGSFAAPTNVAIELRSPLPISGPMPAQLPHQVETLPSNSACTEVQGGSFVAPTDVAIGMTCESKRKHKRKKRKITQTMKSEESASVKPD